MSRLIFDLRNVPDDEADEVRALLEAGSIAFYETRPAPLGLFAGGLWVADDAMAAPSKLLISEYQLGRQARVRAEYAAARRDGTAETLSTTIRQQPAKVLATVLGILFLVGLTVLPFLLFGKFAGTG